MTKIGITGHRFLREIEKINRGIDDALQIVEDHFPEPFILFSSLAEGADRLVVSQALDRWESARLVISLPLPVAEYINDFESESSTNTFLDLMSNAVDVLKPPDASRRDQAYALAGQRILDLSDVLIAIWDGQLPQGEGGTGEIVALAREREHPIVWIHAGNRIPGTTIPLSLGEEQGKLSLENFNSDY